MTKTNKKKKQSESEDSADKHLAIIASVIEKSEKTENSRIESYRKMAGSNKIANIPIEDIS